MGFLLVVEGFSLSLCHTLIVVVGAGENEVLAFGEVDALLHNVGVEDDFCQFVGAVSMGHEPFAAELGHELLAAVVMVDAVAEPESLKVGLEGDEVFVRAVTVVVDVCVFHHLADAEVVFAILVEEDVASVEGCFLQVVDEGLLLQGEVFKTFHFVAEHLEVSKPLVCIFESIFRCGLGGCVAAGSHECC